MSVPQSVSAEALLQTILTACEDRKGEDLQAYDLRGESVLADYLVICTGKSAPQLNALQHGVDKAVKAAHEVFPRNVEGTASSQWILMDYTDVLVHLFHPDSRDFYRIEELVAPDRQIYPAGDDASAE